MGTPTDICILEAKAAENSQTTQYTSSDVRTTITKFTATNYSGSTATITVNIVPSGGSAADTNAVSKTVTLLTLQTYRFPELVGHVLNSGDFISTIASAATSINIRASGRVVTS